jgi:uncharacterized protein (DUF427 family)
MRVWRVMSTRMRDLLARARAELRHEPVSIAGRDRAGFRFADADLAGYVALDFAAFDAWYEEDERIAGHPRDPFHRVDVRRSARAVRIEVGGEVLAETTRARLLFETNLPVRFYLPREDVRVALDPSARSTYCPFKGQASYWSVDVGGRRREDLGWSSSRPRPSPAARAPRGRARGWPGRGAWRARDAARATPASG